MSMWTLYFGYREQFPVWQYFYENHVADDIAFLSVAIDAQSLDPVLLYVQFGSSTFTLL